MNIEDVLKGHGIGTGGGSNIKSIQRGTIQISLDQYTVYDIPINNIDLTKSILIIHAPADTNPNFFYDAVLMEDKIRITNGYYGQIMQFSWQVIEFASGIKSIQRGSTKLTIPSSGSTNIPISTINVSKAFCILHASIDTNINYNYSVVLNSNNITFAPSTSYESTQIVHWNVIEFK